MARSNSKIIPESRHVLQQWKYEIAAEFGLAVGGGAGLGSADTEFAGELGAMGTGSGYGGSWGHLTSRENGSVGGEITKRLVAKAQEGLF
ncbi:alpha/beta-type small acid-soluble spore protein [Paenibacillus segetis]|uniref:Acid-soluble spore protein n=1 Tax=Paenibacillus segetis TaxID=1325360 RepID=A0ABQ1YQD9_9BACL|nr:alpha/beta-type small acid-soluble spore protein [Paenibacillus segetis]GGH32909.1 acid-soluble spore protein [Paenibacillus segetis]